LFDHIPLSNSLEALIVHDHREFLAELGLDVGLHDRLLESIGESYAEAVLSQRTRPEAMEYFDQAVHESHGARVKEIADARDRGARMLGTFCIYVPEEIVLAAGAIPFALCGGTGFSVPYAEKRLPRDICPLLKSTLGLAFSKTCPYGPVKDMAVGETTCDAKKKTWDLLAALGTNIHVLELPQTKTDAARRLWLSEVLGFRTRVEELTGRRIEADALGEAIRVMNRKRRLLAELAQLRTADRPPISGTDALVVMQVALIDEPRRFCDALEGLLAELPERMRNGNTPFPAGARRVLVSGCPAVMGNWKLHHVIESSGAVVVGDESCTGSRYYRHLVEENGRSLQERLEALADRYFRIDCACFSPNTERVERVAEMARECRADAVVQYVLQFCHAYNVESVRIADTLGRAGIPSLTIVSDYGGEDTGQIRTRVEALLESVGV